MRPASIALLLGSIAAIASIASSTGAPAAESVTLTFWDDIYTDDASIVAQKEMVKQFEAAHPGVTVDYVTKPFAQFVPTAKLALSGDGAPDLVICAYGETCNGDLVRAGLVIDAQQYSDKYGWTKNMDPSLLPGLEFTKDGKWGSGDIYGVSETYDLVGVYYNKEKLAKLGLGIPKTMAEFEDDLAKAKAAGELPIQMGDVEKNNLAYAWMALTDYAIPTDDIDAWVYHKPGASIVNDGEVKAVETLKRWYDKGYFSPDFLGYDEAAAMEKFDGGEGVFAINGAWWTGILDRLGDKAGYFLLPPPTEGGKVIATHTLSNPIMITSRSKHPDLAAELLTFLTGPETAQIRANAGLNTTHAEAVTSVPSKTQQDVLDEFRRMNTEGRAVSFLDVTAPGLLLDADTDLQNVLGGGMTAEEFLKHAQELRDKAAAP